MSEFLRVMDVYFVNGKRRKGAIQRVHDGQAPFAVKRNHWQSKICNKRLNFPFSVLNKMKLKGCAIAVVAAVVTHATKKKINFFYLLLELIKLRTIF